MILTLFPILPKHFPFYKISKLLLIPFVFVLFQTFIFQTSIESVPWNHTSGETIAKSIETPSGYSRINFQAGSFEDFLRNLPLKKRGSQVFLFNKDLKDNQDAHERVVDIDTGDKNLQQCADAIMRLVAEYHYFKGKESNISFHLANRQILSYSMFQKNKRPYIKNNKLFWKQTEKQKSKRESFYEYLNFLFTYAGSVSLPYDTYKIHLGEAQSGDILLDPGSPGHAIMIVDTAIHKETKEKIFLLLQSYMPAQDMHVLKNPKNIKLSPWYRESEMKKEIETPEWKFHSGQFRRFRSTYH